MTQTLPPADAMTSGEGDMQEARYATTPVDTMQNVEDTVPPTSLFHERHPQKHSLPGQGTQPTKHRERVRKLVEHPPPSPYVDSLHPHYQQYFKYKVHGEAANHLQDFEDRPSTTVTQYNGGQDDEPLQPFCHRTTDSHIPVPISNLLTERLRVVREEQVSMYSPNHGFEIGCLSHSDSEIGCLSHSDLNTVRSLHDTISPRETSDSLRAYFRHIGRPSVRPSVRPQPTSCQVTPLSVSVCLTFLLMFVTALWNDTWARVTVPLRATPAPNKAELAWPPRTTPNLRSDIRVKTTMHMRIAPATDDVELARTGQFAISMSHTILMNTTVNTRIALATDEVELARRGRFAIPLRNDVLINATVNTKKAPATDAVELARMDQFAHPLSSVILESTTVHTKAAPPTGSVELMCTLRNSSTDTSEGRKHTGATATDEVALAT